MSAPHALDHCEICDQHSEFATCTSCDEKIVCPTCDGCQECDS